MDNKPWVELSHVWKTESAFWNWLRGGIRKIWSKAPVKLEYIKLNRKRIKNPNAKSATKFPEVWGMKCEICKKDFLQPDIEIDHKTPAGSLNKLEDIKEFVTRLLIISLKDLRALCKPCHKIVSHAQNMGISFEEAQVEKEVIRLLKKENSKEMLALFKKHGYSGLTNAKQRREALTVILNKRRNT